HAPPAHASALSLRDALPISADVPFLGPVYLVQAVEDRRLSRPVGADDGEQLAFVDVKGDTVDGGHALERQTHVVELEQRRALAYYRLPTSGFRLHRHDSHLLRRL